MNNGIIIFAGVLFTVLWSWYGFIVKNFRDIGGQGQAKLMTGEVYPTGRSGTAQLGQEVYRANGCAACHTMQVRMRGYGADTERGWGQRNTVLRDFIFDEHVFLGQTRVGPDLAGVGSRPYSTREWHLMHLYNPRTTVPESLMPQYPYLFEKRKIKGRPSPHALQLGEKFVEPGYEVVPTREANALVEYLLSLQSDTRLLEAPILTNDTASAAVEIPATNAPAASTNQ